MADDGRRPGVPEHAAVPDDTTDVLTDRDRLSRLDLTVLDV